jgi:outer membrane protein insertion porin family
LKYIKFHNKYLLVYSLVISVIGMSCNATKNIPEGDYLYKGVKWETREGKIDKDIKTDMQKVARPKPNSTILGFPFKLILYDMLPEPKKQKGLLYKMKYKWAEKPVLLSQVKPKIVETKLADYLFNFGYFRPEIAHEQVLKKKEAWIKYQIKPNTRYTIRDIYYPQDSAHLSARIRTIAPQTLIKKGDFVNLETLEAERHRIDEYVKNRGYFFFNPDFLLYRVDTLHTGEADIYYTVKEETSERARSTWQVGKISVYGNYSLSKDSSIMKQKGKREEKFTLIDNRDRYKAEVYERALLIKENQLYRKNLHYLSIERLMNLNTFKFVKIGFTPDTSANKNLLNTNIYVTPMKKNTLRLEAAASGKTGNYLGSELSVKLRNVNVAKGAEILDLKISGGFDIQVGGKKTQSGNAYTLQGELSYYLPRIIPKVKIKTGVNSFIPRTGFTIGGEFLQRPELYTQRTFKASMEYVWKYRKTTEHTLRPIRVQSIDPSNTTPKFDSILAEDISLRASFEKQLILGSQYQFFYTNTFMENKRFTYSAKFNIGASGNIYSLLAKPNVDTPGAIKILNIPVSQFVRLEADLRGYLKLSDKLILANRVIAGSAIAYGNSNIAPYAEQFFIGGSSSIRAFRIRTLGPGSYHSDESVYQANESGDIKFEANTELRYTMGKYLGFAGFIDAGNIWLRKETPDKPGSGLQGSDFFNEMAVGMGAGVRLDFSVLLIRFDFSIPLRKPWYPEGNRWVLNEINFGDTEWRKDNLILSIGIGYPF